MEKSPIFGFRCCESLASYDQESQYWKTYQISFEWAEPLLLEVLPKLGMVVNGQLFRLVNLEHPTLENVGSVSLPTPTASDPFKHGTGGLHRLMVTGQKYSNGDYRNLPTPTAHISKETGAPSEYERKRRTLISRFIPMENRPIDGKNFQLNPRFVTEMMGFPIDWLD